MLRSAGGSTGAGGILGIVCLPGINRTHLTGLHHQLVTPLGVVLIGGLVLDLDFAINVVKVSSRTSVVVTSPGGA